MKGIEFVSVQKTTLIKTSRNGMSASYKYEQFINIEFK